MQEQRTELLRIAEGGAAWVEAWRREPLHHRLVWRLQNPKKLVLRADIPRERALALGLMPRGSRDGMFFAIFAVIASSEIHPETIWQWLAWAAFIVTAWSIAAFGGRKAFEGRLQDFWSEQVTQLAASSDAPRRSDVLSSGTQGPRA